MSGEGGGGGGRKQRKDLYETIESQKETIAKYETRLRDVVQAYKGLAKEKEALEASFKAISSTMTTGEEEDKKDDDASGKNEENQEEQEAGGDEAASDKSSGDLEAKVKTLSASVMTLTREKSRLETSFQEDRRKLLQERKERDKQIESLRAEMASKKTSSLADVEELKSKLILEKHAREKEASDHALILRELQKLLSDERRGKEKLEHSLHDAQDKIRALEMAGNRNEAHEAKMSQAEARIKAKQEEIEALKQKLREPPAEVEKLKRELFDLKLTHRRELERAERRVEDAEVRATSARTEQEQRVTTLESRLQELSETVGTYDRLRQHDQSEIQKLKDRIFLLDEEKTALARSSHSPAEGQSPEREEDPFQGLALSVLMDRYKLLKEALKAANKKSHSPIDIEEFFSDDEITLRLKRDYDALRREFDGFKHQQSLGGGGGSLAHSPGGRFLLPEDDQEVVHSLKTQVRELKDQNAVARQQLEAVNKERSALRVREKELLEASAELKQKHRQALEAAEADYRSRVHNLETEFQKQRDRCLTLIEEKEDEVSMLKSNMELAFESAFSQPDKESQLKMAANSIARTRTTSTGSRSRKSSSAFPELDELTEGLKPSAQDGMVLHYAQELSHKDVEISALRHKVSEVESAMRELQMNFLVKEEKLSDELERCQEEKSRLQRMTSKEGANMEYLKNVVFNYMLSSDASSREHMLKAIGAVLIFSEAELKRVRDYNASWFWSQGQQQQQRGGSLAKFGFR